MVENEKKPKLVVLNVGKKEIELMKRMELFRPIRKHRVLKLLRVLEAGETFAGMFVINKVKDSRCAGGHKIVMIDGNHRFSAIERFIEKHPDAKIEMRCELWENLSHEEEKDIFIKHSKVLPIGQSDEFYVRQKDCLLWNLIQDDKTFPCKVGIHSSKEGAVRISAIILGYMSRLSTSWMTSKNDWAEASLEITEKDYSFIKEWMKDMVLIFGRPAKGNHWFGQIPVVAMAKVYFSNVNRVGRSELVKRLQRKVFANGALYNDMAHYKAGGSLKLVVSRILECANAGYSDVDKMLVGPEVLSCVKEIKVKTPVCEK